jgi:hypothetical protein
VQRKAISLSIVPLSSILLLAELLFGLLFVETAAGNHVLRRNNIPHAPERLAGLSAGRAITLYDGSLGGTPETQSLIYLNMPEGTASQSAGGGATTLDTTIAGNLAYAGYCADPALVLAVPILDRVKGYRLNWTVQVVTEAHASSDRAGFSVILLGSDLKGIELGFWPGEIWAQEDDSQDPGHLFTHAEGAVYDTTAGLIAYELEIITDTYRLSAAGSPILAGSLRDYTNWDGTIDPYETPSFIFLGDDTSSAQAIVKLAFVSVMVDAELDQIIYLPLLLRDRS